MTTGVFGGVFDPPHLGHVALARAGIEHFALSRLLVRVVASPGHKPVGTPPGMRLRLARLAFAELPAAEVALDRQPRTVDSLEALRLADPVFLLGSDELAALPAWKEPERVLELARLGVATRPGVDPAALERARLRLGRADRITFFPFAPLAASSSGIRRLLRERRPVEGLVPPAVAGEIAALGLYRADA